MTENAPQRGRHVVTRVIPHGDPENSILTIETKYDPNALKLSDALALALLKALPYEPEPIRTILEAHLRKVRPDLFTDSGSR